MGDGLSPLAMIIVTFRSADVIGRCLESIEASDGPPMRIVVVDNASDDRTVSIIQEHMCRASRHRIELVRAEENLGFAAGVNRGLEHLFRDPAVKWFWVLNPDCVVPRETPGHLLRAVEAAGRFSLMGTRTLYADRPHLVQADGGTVSPLTGACRLMNRGADVSAPRPAVGTIDFISGACMVASREFVERAGPMNEDYFLFYEEVDWAMRRGDLPLAYCRDAQVHHGAGSSTGSASAGRAASGFANYFNFRGRTMFVLRHRPVVLPLAFAYAMMQVGRIFVRDGWIAGWGAFCGCLRLPPPRFVRARIGKRSGPIGPVGT